MRRVASSSEFFDILDKIGNGKFVTIGYVTGANLDVPTVSRRNPATNRMKKYPDYTVFGGEEEIGALVKITSYNMRYLNRTTVGQKYGEFKETSGWTDIFIYPGYEFKAVDGLITNFHLPKSTLIMLVSAFATKDLIFKAYNHAVEEKYRFFSFGDAMLII